MKCRFSWCVFNEKGRCLLRDIAINSSGMCEFLDIVNLPKEIVQKYKDKFLNQIDGPWKYRRNK